MVRSLLLTVCLLLTAAVAWAQTKIEGKVTDPTGPAFGVTVKVLQGTQLIAGGVTDFDGQYSISVNPGKYDVQFELLGFAPRKETGVSVLAGRSNFVNQKFTTDEGITITELIVTAYKAPLMEKDNTSSGKVVTADQIRAMPTRSINTIVATTAGVSSVEGGDVTIRGSRADATNYYVDGIRVSKNSVPRAQDVEQIQVITGGLGAEYGDVTGGVVSLYTKGPAQKITGGLEAETTQKLDPFGYTQINANLAGPILKKKDNSTLLGFRVSGTGTWNKDDDVPAIPVYRVNDENYAALTAHPVRKVGTTIVNSAEYLTNDGVDILNYREDQASRNYDLAGKLDLRLNQAIDMSVTGTMQRNKDKFEPANWNVLNSRNNPTSYTDRFAGIFRFRHRLGGATAEESKDKKASVISNAQYMLSFGVEQEKNRRSDPRHGDNLFDYGHVGQFQYRWDSVIGFENGAPRHVGNVKNFVGYTAGTQNPILAAYNEFAVEGFEDSYLYRNGVSSANYRTIWNDMHTNVGAVYNSWRKQQFDTYTLNATAGFDLTPGGSKNGRHSIQFGLLYEQRADRSYEVAPNGLQQIGDLLANAHITGVDSNKVIRKVWVPQFQDSVDIYDTFVGAIEPDSKFYKKVRESLGIAVDDYVNVAGLRPDQLSLDMFSPKELADQEVLFYYGYDYLGNQLPSTTTFRDFFTATDADGSRTFPVLARTPVYQAAYIQDKFSFRDIIFRVGLRVDRYDANTKILKDPYSLYEIMSANEFYATTGLNQPTNVDDAWKVYTADGDEKAVIGYRNENQWYDAKGTAVSDGNVLFGGGVVNPRLKYKDERIKDLDFEPDHSFGDYEPQVNWTPRLAFSFPISEDAGFFAHYDILVQRPPGNNFLSPLDYYYFYDSRTNRNLSNAALKPERTIDYEVGFQQKLNNYSAIKMSAFYRELRDMVQRRTYFYVPTINSYDTYGNIDFSTVKGFSFTYDLRRVQNAQMQLAYTLQFADGTGSDANSQSGNAARGNLRTLFPLSNDERHNIQASIDYRFDRGKKYNGPRIGGKNFLADAGANLLISAVSGRPYTAKERATRFDGAGTIGALNGNRLPWRLRVDLRLDKNINLTSNPDSPLSLNVYMRVSNILGIKNISGVYTATGSPIDDGYDQTSNGQSDIQQVIDSGKSIEAYNASYQWRLLNPDNYGSPRRIYVGAAFSF